MGSQARDLHVITWCENLVIITARACLVPTRPTGAGSKPDVVSGGPARCRGGPGRSLGQGRATEVGELDGLAAGHRPSTGSTPVRGRAGARPPARIAGCLATYPWRCCGGPVAHPEQGGLLAAEEPAQLAQHLDEGVGVVVAAWSACTSNTGASIGHLPGPPQQSRTHTTGPKPPCSAAS